MIDNNVLEFDEKNSFNNQLVYQNNDKMQEEFIGFLLKNKKWQINKGKIIFPEFRTKEQIQKLLIEFNNAETLKRLKIKKDVMDKISTLGYLKYEEILKSEFKRFETKENNKKIQR